MYKAERWHVAPDRDVNLSPSARARLTAPIRTALGRPMSLSGPHTMPVSPETWQHYASSLDVVLKQLQNRADETPPNPNDFGSVRRWIEEILSLRDKVISLTLALRPFEYFQEGQADEMLTDVNRLTRRVVEIVETNQPPGTRANVDILTVTNWSSVECAHQKEPLSRAFGLDSEDLRDENGEFSPARVFSAYYLQNNRLLQRVLPHLHSLGLPAVVDPLVAVSIVGWILSATDSVGAFCAMDALFSRLLSRSNQVAVVTALDHLAEIEPRLRQSRFRANRSFSVPFLEADLEWAALRLAEGYKRLLEGPVRQYGWLYHCIGTGTWSNPPMLTTLRDLLAKDGGWLAEVAKQMILTDVRNGEAHESLLWDGIDEVFVTEAGPVDPALVHVAAVTADAFARGCQAAVACYRALSIEPRIGGPAATDPGRSAAWLRAEAHFGTNGLQVTKANFNAKVAKITVARLQTNNINPCFQALVCCHALLPGVQWFEIYADGYGEAVLCVSADALKRTHPIWERALDKFSSMPLSTFLPANLAARSSREGLSKAVRSVSWIALDDLLDAVDSRPAELDADDLRLIVERIDLVATATRECLATVPIENELRLRIVNSAAEELSEELKLLTPPSQLVSLNEMEQILAARRAWEAWGPVPRLPGIQIASQAGSSDDHGPRLRSEKDGRDLRWRTI